MTRIIANVFELCSWDSMENTLPIKGAASIPWAFYFLTLRGLYHSQPEV